MLECLEIGSRRFRDRELWEHSGAAHRISRLTRAFTPRERAAMLSKLTERERYSKYLNIRFWRQTRFEFRRWASFYRHWCLKEAVLKATGDGISEDLRRLEFETSEEYGRAIFSYCQDE